MCQGPSAVFGLPNWFPLIIASQVLNGIFAPMMIIPCIPEMIDAVSPLYPKQMTSQIKDQSLGVFNSFLGVGQIFGPIFSSFMTIYMNFRYCCDCVGIACPIIALIYWYITRK